ncbi:endonuclease Q family protein [Patescibacteria group bacterium]|nr:endonuclease Q family protein [Patescibacteria group bacterium]
MEIIADLHIHSRHSRATSKNLSIENLEKYAKIKGLNLLGTGDFQHPLWRKEIDEKLKEDEKGILRTSNGYPFIWQTEISLMYSQGGKRRAIHLLVFAPNSKVVDKITNFLSSKGRLDYDGRPIFGMSARDFVKDLKEIDDQIEISLAHCMTPWFGVFGSKAGFDSLKECFQDQVDKIYSVESGISADPEMLGRFEEFISGKINILSFSDAHSYWPWRLGREATIFDLPELSYKNIITAIRTGVGLKATIETPPEYGKYHRDGHRLCNFSCDPKKTTELGNICPICKKQLIIGVENRVEEIAIKPRGFKPDNLKKFYTILPLHEVISLVLNSPVDSKKTWEVYNKLLEEFPNEFEILLKIPKEKLLKNVEEKIVDVILKNRDGKIKVQPGYDGEYGKVLLGEKQETLL